MIRVSYPYSIIDGGVVSAVEFQQVRLSKALLVDHYFDVGSRVEMTRMPEDRWLYASWRQDKSIYWTAHRILVHKGEPVVTDGVNLIRGRCGNRLSDKPRMPVARVQPPEVTSELPITSIEEAKQLPPASMTYLFDPVTLSEEPIIDPEVKYPKERPGIPRESIAATLTPIMARGTLLSGPSLPAVPGLTANTPEPAAWVLTSGGLLWIAALVYFRKKTS